MIKISLTDCLNKFKEGYDFSLKNLEISLETGIANKLQIDEPIKAEELANNYWSLIGTLAAPLTHPIVTYKFIKHFFLPNLTLENNKLKNNKSISYFMELSGLGIDSLAEIIEEKPENLEQTLMTPMENLPDDIYNKLYLIRMLLHTAFEFAQYSKDDVAELFTDSSSFKDYVIKPPWYPKSLVDDIRERHTDAMLDAVAWMHGFDVDNKKYTVSIDDLTANMSTFNPQKDLVNPQYDENGVLYNICNQPQWRAYFLKGPPENKDSKHLDGYFHQHDEVRVPVLPKDVGHDKYTVLKCPECGDVLGIDYDK